MASVSDNEMLIDWHRFFLSGNLVSQAPVKNYLL